MPKRQQAAAVQSAAHQEAEGPGKLRLPLAHIPAALANLRAVVARIPALPNLSALLAKL